MGNKNIWWIIAVLIIGYLVSKFYISEDSEKIIKVGFPAVSTSLPLFVAIEEGLFKEKGLKVEPIRFETANQIVEALVTDRIDATSVCADYPFLTIATKKDDAFKIYAWEMLDTIIPFDIILSKKGSGIKTLADLQEKKLPLFQVPNSNII